MRAPEIVEFDEGCEVSGRDLPKPLERPRGFPWGTGAVLWPGGVWRGQGESRGPLRSQSLKLEVT